MLGTIGIAFTVTIISLLVAVLLPLVFTTLYVPELVAV